MMSGLELVKGEITYREVERKGRGFLGYSDIDGHGQVELFEVDKVLDAALVVKVMGKSELKVITEALTKNKYNGIIRKLFKNREDAEEYFKSSFEDRVKLRVEQTKEEKDKEGFIEDLVVNLSELFKREKNEMIREEDLAVLKELTKHYLPDFDLNKLD